jgi:hypothetical protein
MTRKNTLVVMVVIAFAPLAAMVCYKKNDPLLPVALTTFQQKNGWGYEIDVDGKTFIRQTVIPAVNGESGFASREQAMLVGSHALAKLKAGKMPQITVAELRDWGALQNGRIH